MAANTPDLDRANEIRELAREIVDSHPEPLHMGGDNWATEDKQLFIQVAKLWDKSTGLVIIRPLNGNLGERGIEVFVSNKDRVNTYLPGPWEAYLVQLASEIKNAEEETNKEKPSPTPTTVTPEVKTVPTTTTPEEVKPVVPTVTPTPVITPTVPTPTPKP